MSQSRQTWWDDVLGSQEIEYENNAPEGCEKHEFSDVQIGWSSFVDRTIDLVS